MNIKTLVLAGLATAGSVFAADAMPIHFNAVLTAGKEKRFGLSSSESAAASSWLTLGDSFEGYKLKSFDDEAQTLVLEHDGKTERLSMAAGSITPANTKATLNDAREVINKMHFEEMLARSLEQQKQMVAKMTGQMAMKNSGRTPEEKAEFSAFQAKLMETMWSELKPEEVKADMARAYSEIFSKEELQSLGDFYSTPTGQALISKQPEVQQKLAESMMPRMMKAMPKVQELAKAYAAAHAPKPVAAPVPEPASGTPTP